MSGGGPLIRRAGPGDLEAVARIHVESARAAYRGLLPETWLEAFTVADRAAQLEAMATDPAYRGLILVGGRGGAVEAFVQVGPCRDGGGWAWTGEVWTMYADRSVWGTGVAGPVLAAGVEALRAHGYDELVLWVLEANARARRFYERNGWRPDGATRTLPADPDPVPELRYRLSGAAGRSSSGANRSIIDWVD